MSSSERSGDRHTPAPSPLRPRAAKPGAPSVLDLVRLSPEPVFPPGGEALYRQIAILTELEPGKDVLDAACGRGVATTFLATTYGVEASGLDTDPALVSEAEQRARSLGLEDRLHFQSTPLDDLPYQDNVFDVAIGEVGLGASSDPAGVINELTRVTRPLGSVILVQLVWAGHIDDDRREALVQHLGVRPMLLVEWKQLLRDAGCVDFHVEDWSDDSGPFRPAVAGPLHDIAKLFSFRQKIAILRRALKRWGWRGVRGAIVYEQEIHRLLTRQRVLGLSLIKATKWPDTEIDLPLSEDE